MAPDPKSVSARKLNQTRLSERLVSKGLDGVQPTSGQIDNPSPDSNFDREATQDLAWSLIDERISKSEFEKLSADLSGSEAARKAYLDVFQLHADLQHILGSSQTH